MLWAANPLKSVTHVRLLSFIRYPIRLQASLYPLTQFLVVMISNLEVFLCSAGGAE